MALPHLDYVVVIVDARGTPERSKEFQDVTYGDWGEHVVDDHAVALEQLGERCPFMDLGRVGIWGHSWRAISFIHCEDCGKRQK
jgi:dipeptidyl-peptidase 4